MERRDVPHSEKEKPGEEGRPKGENTESPEVDHESKNAGEPAALVSPKPGGIHLHHARGAERLHVAIDPANRDKQSEQPPEGSHAEEDVHGDGARRADEHGAFAAETIGQEAVDDQAAGIREERGGDDRSHLRSRKTELRTDGVVAQGEVVAAEIKRGVEQAEKGPVQAAAGAEAGRMRNGDGCGHTFRISQLRFRRPSRTVLLTPVNIESLHIGMKVRHPQYGVGTIRSLTEHTAEIAFDDAPRTVAPASSGLEPAEATATLSELQLPLANLIRDTAHAVVDALGLEQKDVVVEGLATRWQRGTLVMQSADTSLQPKEVPLETFFHKIVMIRNNLRVLEQKVNASDKLTDADKFELQQDITRCYGSLTTFNILFKNKDDQFRTGG